MPQYKLAATAKSDRLEARAAAFSVRVGVLIQRADNYCAGRRAVRRVAVLRGHQHAAHSPTPRMVVLGLGYMLFLGSVIWLATFPVSVSI